jgi:hypothetical protein
MSQTESAEDSGKSLAPNFLRVCTDREATEGKMTRFDCRVTGRPYPEVTWYLNGKQICDDATHKVLVNESGNHALMITNVHRSNAGTVSFTPPLKPHPLKFYLFASLTDYLRRPQQVGRDELRVPTECGREGASSRSKVRRALHDCERETRRACGSHCPCCRNAHSSHYLAEGEII